MEPYFGRRVRHNYQLCTAVTTWRLSVQVLVFCTLRRICIYFTWTWLFELASDILIYFAGPPRVLKITEYFASTGNLYTLVSCLFRSLGRKVESRDEGAIYLVYATQHAACSLQRPALDMVHFWPVSCLLIICAYTDREDDARSNEWQHIASYYCLPVGNYFVKILTFSIHSRIDV